MEKKYSKDKLKNMADFISAYISEDECEDNTGNVCDCKNYENIEECYMLSNNKCNSEWAESIDYGGYDTEEEFLEQLFG